MDLTHTKFVLILFFLFLFILYNCFKQAFVHKAVMDELKRIIEDSEVCLMAKCIIIYKYRLICVHSLAYIDSQVFYCFFLFILFYVS